MSLHTWRCQGPRKPSSCAAFTLNPHWGRAARGEKNLVSMHTGLLQCLPGFSVREGGSPGKNAGADWPILVAIPFSSTILPAAQAANSPDYLVLPEPLRAKQVHHLHTWPSQGQTQVLQGSFRSKPQWMTHMQRWK